MYHSVNNWISCGISKKTKIKKNRGVEYLERPEDTSSCKLPRKNVPKTAVEEDLDTSGRCGSTLNRFLLGESGGTLDRKTRLINLASRTLRRR